MGRLAGRVSAALGLAVGFAVFLPATVAAHSLNATYTSRLPLAVYVVGAATTVALSFIFVIVRDVRAAPARPRGRGLAAAGLDPLPAPCHRPDRLDLDRRPGDRRRLERRARSRRSSCGSTAGSAWPSCARWSGRSGTCSIRSRRSTTSGRPSCAGWGSGAGPSPTIRSDSVAGRPSSGSRSSSGSSWSIFAGASTLFVVLVGYTALTLAMMAQFGRDEWRSQGETFTVWFRLLGRLAPLAAGRRGGAGRSTVVRERPPRAGLVGR